MAPNLNSSNVIDDEPSFEAFKDTTSSTTPYSAVDAWDEEKIEDVVKLWNLSSKQREQLCQLRDLLKDIKHHKNDPYEVVRFLLYRPHDISEAEKEFRNMIKWRNDNNVDTILQDFIPPHEMQMYTPSGILDSYDKDGDPILLERIGALDIIGLLNRYGHDDLIKYTIWAREKNDWEREYEIRNNGKKFKQLTAIYDLDGLSLRAVRSKKVVNMFIEFLSYDQDCYCERAKRIIILRAPKIFCIAWNIVKHFLQPSIVKKMVFTNKSDYLSKLQQFIDLEALPPSISGEIGHGKPAKGMPQHDFEGGKLPTP